MNSSTILVVDDEPQLRRVMRTTLSDLGYLVIEAKSGEEAIELLRRETPELILLDWNMPGMGGLEACRVIRSGSDTPIIILTVRNTEQDTVHMLDAGADDYVTKPFSTQELLARIRAAMRRGALGTEPELKILKTDDLEVDFKSRQATANGKAVRLTPKEFELLRYLVTHANEAIPHRKLLQTVWGSDYAEELGYLRVFVNALRRKLEPDPSKPKYLITEPWLGYRFVISPDALK
jgi:two-component system KDP operon response regulator KdpE